MGRPVDDAATMMGLLLECVTRVRSNANFSGAEQRPRTDEPESARELEWQRSCGVLGLGSDGRCAHGQSGPPVRDDQVVEWVGARFQRLNVGRPRWSATIDNEPVAELSTPP